VRECPVCAEDIPVDTVICPYCSEHLTGPGGSVPLARYDLPTQFRTEEPLSRRWNISLRDDELIATSKQEELRVPRAEAGSLLQLDKRRIIIAAGAKPTKIALDDVGYLAVEHWMTGRATPRTSQVAKDALIYAIVGIFCCQIVLGVLAVYRANTASKQIKAHPELLSGQGMATAAFVIGIIDLIMFVFGMISNFVQMSQLMNM
jgi:hypothetical protein